MTVEYAEDDRGVSDVEPKTAEGSLHRKCTFLRPENVERCKITSTTCHSNALKISLRESSLSGRCRSSNTTASKREEERRDRTCVTHRLTPYSDSVNVIERN